jgi:RNA ligase (TIGR02306 family)
MFEFKPKWERAVIGTTINPPVTLPQSDGSLFKVPLTTILKIENHPNADRLSIATVYGFQVIIQRDKFQVGNRVLYAPVDSIIPPWLDAIVFGTDAKVKLRGGRVRQIRLRGLASQGMIIPLSDIESKVNTKYLEVEQDLSVVLGITKYEPPARRGGTAKNPNPRNKPLENPRFHKYGGVDNIKWYPNTFDGKEVVIQEKLHGSNCRASIQKSSADTFLKKIRKFFHMLPEYEFCHGSNMVQLQNRRNCTGFYGSDVYGAVLEKVNAYKKLQPGETIFGELIGPGIQKGYEYGHTEHHFVLFDVKVTKEDGSQEYLSPNDALKYAKERGFDFVPVLYQGIFNFELAKQLSMGPSVYCPKEKVREGVVIKDALDYSNHGGKRALKLISEEYLADASNTDDH